MEDKKKYNYMERVLQDINRYYITLSEDAVKLSNEVLKEAITQIIQKMKETNELFNKLYTCMYYGGSFYDGLKIGNPEEFDLDLLLVLPVYAKPELPQSNIPGFMHLQLKEMERFKKQPEAKAYAELSSFMDSKNYLITTKVMQWIESVVTKALNTFPLSGMNHLINISQGDIEISTTKSGPAVTLKIKGNVCNTRVQMDVDLVPCFAFKKDLWPSSPYRSNVIQNKGKSNYMSSTARTNCAYRHLAQDRGSSQYVNTRKYLHKCHHYTIQEKFLLVPKKPTKSNQNLLERYWRLSFQEQEGVLIHDAKTLKPALKLMKKLRDTFNDAIIASYFIKTIFMWEALENEALFNNNSLSYVFMFMLKKYQKYLEDKKIPYFWNKKYNLIDTCNPDTIQNYSNKLKRMIQKIESNPTDQYMIVQFLLNPTEQNHFKMHEKFQKLHL